MINLKWVFLGLAVLLNFGCSHGSTIQAGPKTIVTKSGVVSVWADWVKSKGKKYDLDFHIRNESEQYIIVMLNDMVCKRGDVVGRMKYTFFNTGERTIDLGPHQEKGAHMVCQFGFKAAGPYEVDIANIWSNPTHDRKTTGTSIATNVVWTLPDTEK